jgi:hypothetical protein
MTALGMGPGSTKKQQMGEVIWLPKPFRPEALAAAIARAQSMIES